MLGRTKNPIKQAPSGLNSKWLVGAMADVESSASTVIVVESADPRRERQLIDYLLRNFQRVYRYHPWTGLEEADQTLGRFAPVIVSAGSDYEPGLKNECRDLGGALRYMDRLLRKEERTALILRGLERPGDCLEKNVDLVHALRSWAESGEIVTSKSVICLVSSNPLATIDQVTLDRTSLVRPELASYDERLDIVHRTIEKAHMRLDEDGKRAIARAAAGLNLHQTQCVLYKTYHTTHTLHASTVKAFKADYIRRSDILLRFAKVM